MTPEKEQEAFAEMAGAFIDLANKYSKTYEIGLVAVSITHAAARYNAYGSATMVDTKAQMQAAHREHIAHYVQQYRDFVEHHYDQYVDRYEELTTAKPAE